MGLQDVAGGLGGGGDKDGDGAETEEHEWPMTAGEGVEGTVG